VLVPPAGFRHPILRSVHPTNPHWDEDAATRPVRYDLDWEADFDERIWEAYGAVI
jgi:hypothetical protein